MHMGGYVGRVGGLAVALGVGSAVTLGMGCGVATADPAGSSTAKDVDSKTPDQAKPKKKRTPKPRQAARTADNEKTSETDETPATPREALDKVGTTLRTAVHDELDSLDLSERTLNTPRVVPNHRVSTKPQAKTFERPRPTLTRASQPDTAPENTAAKPEQPETQKPLQVDIEAITTIPKSALSTGIHALSAVVPRPGPKVPAPKQIESIEKTATVAVSTVINTVLNPFSVNPTPEAPAEPPTAWAMLAFARREFEHAFRQPQDLLTQASTLTSTVAAASNQPADTTGAIALAPGIVVPKSLIDNVDATDGPSLFDQVTVAALSAFRQISQVIGVDLTSTLGGGIVVPDPPRILTLGLDVRATEFTAPDADGDGVDETWQVWEISNPRSDSEEHVIAFHGGGLTAPPTIFHWLDYAQMSRQTGATVIVPRYPLIPDGGTAENTVPPAADLIASYVEEYGAENVSVYGESSGGMVAVLAVQKIVRDCGGDDECLRTRVPSRMVLSSPAVADPDFASDPNVVLVNDPLYGVPTSDGGFSEWQSQQHPELSDIFAGPVEGLPPTTMYIGSREVIAPGALKFAKMMDDAGSDVHVVIGMGQMHGWASLPINSQYGNYRDDVYRQLGIVDDTAATA